MISIAFLDVILQKSTVEKCIFGYMALHIECQFNKNSLLRSLAFSVAGMFDKSRIKTKVIFTV